MIVRGDVRRKGDVRDPLPVRRDVGEPVVEAVVRDLLLLASVGSHAPDLHSAGARRVEVDVRAIRGELRPVVQSRRGGESDLVTTRGGSLLVASGDGNLIDVE